MATNSPSRQITPRDLEMLAALDAYAPLTALQIKLLSRTWASPFGSARLVRDRLCLLAKERLVTSHPYAVLNSPHAENYYLLARPAYQLLHGPDYRPARKRQFSPIGLSRHRHQHAISEFLVHTVCGAQYSGVNLFGYQRENTVRLEAGGDAVYPDASFVLKRGDENFRFYLEMDVGTERVESEKVEADSIQRKLRTYDAFQSQNLDTRFRVLFVSAGNSAERIRHILAVADRVTTDPKKRTLFYGLRLMDYVGSRFAVTSPIFLNHRGERQSLVPDIPASTPLKPRVLLAVR